MNHDHFADNVRIAAELVGPRRETEHRRRRPGSRIILGPQRAPQPGVHPQHPEVVARDHVAEHHTALHASEGEAIEADRFGKNRVLFPEILQFPPGEPVSISVGIAPRELIQAMRVADTQGLKDIGVENGEDGRVQAQGQCDGCHNRPREARRPAKSSQGIADVLPQRLDQMQPTRVAAFFLHLLEAAKLHASLAGGVRRAHTGGQVPPGLHGDVEFQFLFEFILHAAAKQQGADAQLTIAPLHVRPTPAPGRSPRRSAPSCPSRVRAVCARRLSGGRNGRGDRVRKRPTRL